MDLGYCLENHYRELRTLAEEVGTLLNGYTAWPKIQKAGEKEPGANIPVWEAPAEYFVEEINGY